MKILVLDKSDEFGDKCRADYRRMLERLGHEVIDYRHLWNCDEYNQDPHRYLSQFDLAVVHPHHMDFRVLLSELERRKEFRIFYTKCDGEPERDGRVVYHSLVFSDNLQDWIENWRPIRDTSA